MAISYILRSFDILYGPSFGLFWGHLVYFSRIGMLYQEKSGNPGADNSSAIKPSIVFGKVL
jgi:hypothetical protein